MSDHPEDRHPVTTAARKARGESDEQVLSTGVKVRLRPVSPSLIADISSSVKYPNVPRIVTEDGRELENPNHPDYIRACEEVDNQRAGRVLEAIVMFAFDLVDGVPDDGWDKKVRLMERMGSIDLKGLDLDDPVDREFAYKKYIAIGNEDITLAGGMAGIRGEDVAAATETFRG